MVCTCGFICGMQADIEYAARMPFDTNNELDWMAIRNLLFVIRKISSAPKDPIGSW